MNDTVTRAYLADIFYTEVGIPFTESLKLVDSMISEIGIALKKEGKVKIPRFGSFFVRSKKKRVGRNPKTGENATINARKVISFYPSKTLKSLINS